MGEEGIIYTRCKMEGPDDDQEGVSWDGGGGVLSGRRVSYTQDARWKVQMPTRKVPRGMEVEGFCGGGGYHNYIQDARST